MTKCSQCGGTEFEKGTLSGLDGIKFQSAGDSQFSTRPVAYFCLKCGHIEIFGSIPE